MFRFIRFLTLIFLVFAVSTGCQKAASNGKLYDPLPQGTILKQGSWNATLPGGALTAGVYLYAANSLLVIRLTALTSPNGTSGTIFLEDQTGTAVFTTPLRAPNGNQNYDTPVSSSVQPPVIAVVLRQGGFATSPEIARAQLLAP